MKKATLLFLLLFTWLSGAFCQHPAHRDSMLRAARADAKTFRLDSVTWKKYRHKLPKTSDYFKPKLAKVSHPDLFKDSVYVTAYRQAAYKKNKHRRSPWHYALVVGGTAAGLYIVLVAAVLIIVAPQMG